MNVTLSSKGQLVIPKSIRDDLRLAPGTEFSVRVNNGEIVLHRVVDAGAALEALDRLHGMFAHSDVDLLKSLEEEHQQEIARDERRSGI